MSPMSFASENFGKEASSIYTFIFMLMLPIPFLLLMSFFNFKFMFLNSANVAIFVIIVVAIVLLVSGSFSKLINIHKGINNFGYTITNKDIYFDGKALVNVDVASFSLLKADDTLGNSPIYKTNDYASDKHHVYYQGKKIQAFSSVGAKLVFSGNELLLVNKNQVVLGDKILVDAEPEAFSFDEKYPHWSFSEGKAQYHVYFSGIKLPQLDKESFVILSDYYAKDDKHIFNGEKVILPQADAKTFQFVEQDNRFAFDKKHVYFVDTSKEHIIDSIDHRSLMPLFLDSYIKDKNNIYYIEQYVTVHKLDVDYKSFTTYQYDAETQSDAHDNSHYFHNGVIVGEK